MQTLSVFLLSMATCLSSFLFAHQTDETPLYRKLFFWPNFCHQHLQNDPDGCSSWYLAGHGIFLEKYSDYHNSVHNIPAANISPDLIERVSSRFHLIPSTPTNSCGYGYCEHCGENLKQFSLGATGSNGTKVYIAYNCNCTHSYIDPSSPAGDWEKAIISRWKFCNCPAIYSGYFDIPQSEFFPFFEDFLQYYEENPSCECYWPERSNKLREIQDYIALAIVSPTLALISQDSLEEKLHCIHFDIQKKLETRKLVNIFSHSHLYSQLSQSLRSLDPYTYCAFAFPYNREKKMNYSNLSYEEMEMLRDQFCHDVLAEIRPMFLDLYEDCFKKHPHPKIAQEIEWILQEMNSV